MTVNPLERWYLRRFREVEGGYIFKQWGCDVHFTDAEVAGLRAEWRRLWLSPWLWGGWLVFGVALPILLYERGTVAGAFALGGVLGLMMVVTLVHTHFRVNDRAQQRVTIAEARDERGRQYSWSVSIVFVVMASIMFWREEGWLALAWLAVGALHAFFLALTLWRYWRARSAVAS